MMTAMICKYCCCCCDLRQHNPIKELFFWLSRRSIEFQRRVHPDVAAAAAAVAAAADVAVAGCDLSDPWPSQEVHENVKVRRWGAEPRNFGFPPSKNDQQPFRVRVRALTRLATQFEWYSAAIMVIVSRCGSLNGRINLTKDHFKWTDTI